MKVLVLSPYPREGASFRFRIWQYMPYLASQGIECTVAHCLSSGEFARVHAAGHYALKSKALAAWTWRLMRALRDVASYDAVLVHREIYPLATLYFERWLQRLGRPIILDVDDAIYFHQPHSNRLLRRFRNPAKVGALAAMSRLVIVSNEYLADWFRQHNPAVAVLPTAIDIDRFRPPTSESGTRPLTIGWIGSPSTAPYLQPLWPALRHLRQRYQFEVHVVGAGELLRSDGVAVTRVPWSLEREVDICQQFDIGVYPLPDDPWALGKGGFKTIQYMAVGVPVIASPVGINREIIQPGENGLLARTTDEWESALERLLADAALRRRLGQAGRRTAEARYSTAVHGPVLAGWIRRATVGVSEVAGPIDRVSASPNARMTVTAASMTEQAP